MTVSGLAGVWGCDHLCVMRISHEAMRQPLPESIDEYTRLRDWVPKIITLHGVHDKQYELYSQFF